ncbi:MAG: membrane dipeptidase [Gammaproteobacteria bacterium]|nr:membrane dipeptidase [Gammaproteobacteria bacterium]
MTKIKINFLLLICSFVTIIFSDSISADDTALVHARKILQKAPIADGHNDLPWVIRESFNSNVEGYDISVRAQFDTDIPRLREGRVGTQFWSVYVPTTMSPLDAMRTQLEQIDIAKRMINLYPDDLAYATSTADIITATKDNRIASLLGIEGGHTIGNSLGVLRSYYNLGVRYMTLTHFHSNDWADSATDINRHDGITKFGEEVISEMNRLGMIVDLSHVSTSTMNDVLDVTKAPVMFSHSSARSLTNHSRNVPDKVLKRVTKNGGIVMVTFVPEYVNEKRRDWAVDLIPLTKDIETDAEWNAVYEVYKKKHGSPPLATLSDVADHIEHVAAVAGFDHVGIGGDYYGQEGEDLVTGLEDVAKYPILFAELIRRGWSDKNLAKLSSGNLLRVFSGVEKVSAKLKQTITPSIKKFMEAEK